MPLTFVKAGETSSIKKIAARDKTKQFLESLGFTQGSSVTVVSAIHGNIIVNIKDSRVAISKEMANKIIV